MKLSVIIPAYNSSKTIRRCLDSVIFQNFTDMEIIVVNDGSKDNTPEILKTYKDNIKIIDIENGGAANARNIGLSNAKGDFIMFLDADDYIEKNAISKLFYYEEKYDADIVRAEYVLEYSDKRRKKPLHRFKENRFIKKEEFKKYIYPLFIEGITLNRVWMTLFKKDIISNLRFKTDMKTAEDAIFSIDAYTNARSVYIASDELYIYCENEGSLTGSGLSVLKKYKCNFILSLKIIKKLKQWDMYNLKNIFKAIIRPVILTFDKIKRTRDKKIN